MTRRVVVVVFLAVVVALATATPASAKSFEVRAIQIEATLNPDASMRVVEHITYAFDGEFHNGLRPIPRGDYEIVDMRVEENGQPLPFEGAPYDLVWHYDARDELRTFDISYTVLGAAKVGPDVAELYWKWVGEAHPGVGRVRVALEVPGDGLDVRAWGHGPLNGLVEPRGALVLWSVDGLPGGTFVEGRVTVPTQHFTVTPSGDARLPGILAEEQRLADEANARREREAEDARRRERIRDFLSTTFLVVPIAGWVVFFLLWTRYGREHKVTADVGEYLREPPDDPPAFVQMLRSWGSVPSSALSSTIVDLAQRGYLTIEEIRVDRTILPDKVDWRLTWRENDEHVRKWEATILARLFASGRETTQSEIVKWCERNRTEAKRWWDEVQREMRDDFRARHYIEGGKGWVYAANVLAAVAVGGLGVLTVSFGALVGIAGIASGAVQLAATVVLRRRTPAGRQRLEEWAAFERFLRDFSELEEAPVGHLILWERYLVYAVALGVTAQVARALAARIPAEVAAQGAGTQGFAPWFSGTRGPALDSIGSFADFGRGFGPAIVAAANPPSSSSSGSGGGGGFSGGGGGGGGGGGVGAS